MKKFFAGLALIFLGIALSPKRLSLQQHLKHRSNRRV
jgi:hypothetical protein